MPKNQHTPTNQTFDRGTVIALLTNAIKVESFRFTRKLAATWLENFPGDLAIEHLYAQSLLKQDQFDLAIPVIKRIVFTDPEYLPGQRLLAYSSSLTPYKSVTTAQHCIHALGGTVPEGNLEDNWSTSVREALAHLKEKDFQEAELSFIDALSHHPDTPLPAVLHLKLAGDYHSLETLSGLAENYTQRWPDTIALNLIYARTLNRLGNEEKAVTLLHHAVALDIGGQVATRLWGTHHPYDDLWPSNPKIRLEVPIPADVAIAVGWNQLPHGGEENIHPKTSSEDQTVTPVLGRMEGKITSRKRILREAQKELKELAVKIKQPILGNADARFPAYVLITSRQGLENQYGPNHLESIFSAIERVEKNTKALSGWSAYTIYIDDPICTDKLRLPPALANDPWSIKNLIKDLDHILASKGEKIGAILIVGSDQVIPFHMLPNPIDDFDTHVPSDNPYACDDENYFIPLWPIGRLPGSAGDDPKPLIKQLNKISGSRQAEITSSPNPPWPIRIFQSIFKNSFLNKKIPSFGYSAEVWRRASHAVYRPIGKPHNLKISPPVNARKISNITKKSTQLAYYNLHGLENSSEWYGQRDPVEAQLGPDYPVALRPEDIKNSGRAPKIVFSEACFGANIINKNVEEAICLKFLDSGSKAVIGSTCTSYGSISTPLIAADLLGKAFWSYLQDSYPVGESLRRAKIHLAKEMNKRQGYLDGEDQKTLISFVLYGDPLANGVSTQDLASEKGNFHPLLYPSNINTICDKVDLLQGQEVPPEVIKQVKGIVEHYLPGMRDAKILYSYEHTECKGHECPTPALAKNVLSQANPSRKVITLSKQYSKNSQIHSQHARITINSDGRVTKLAVSR